MQHADLFFADAVILVEGAAEKMLVPHFIRNKYKFLNQCYISLLEIGGSHAHRLRPLIEELGLLTLIITDLDAGSETTGAAEPPAYGMKQVTNNTTLKKWVPALSTIDELLAAEDFSKILDKDPLFAVRAAYQIAVKARLPGKKERQEALPNTFEDALVLENLGLFSQLDGKGLVRKFRDAISNSPDIATLGARILEDLKAGSKAEFALDVLGLETFESLKVPSYIDEGLNWLENRLRKRKEDGVIEQAEESVIG